MAPTRLVSDKFGLIRNWTCASCRSNAIDAKANSFSSCSGRTRSSLRGILGTSTRKGLPSRRLSGKKFSTACSLRAAAARQPKLPDGQARTRFAPSPTGYLHIGGLRTALLSYLLAKRTGGQFLLRIEDTDQKRLVRDAESRLCHDLQWAGLQWDEGPGIGGPYGPYRQSERNQIYQDHARKLLDEGSAYRCFCAPQSDATAQIAFTSSGCYQNCSSLSADESLHRAEDDQQAFTVRLHAPQISQKRIYKDIVYGKIQRLKRSPAASQTASEDDTAVDASDTILMKSDGTPTYHFANVIDDHLMKITHVIRGLEWMASTPLHYDIYSAFGWDPPEFAHVGLLVDENKAKLSKRNQDLALDVSSMRDEHGVLPDTLNNFLALLGWSNPTNNDVMAMAALVRNFDLKFTRGNTMVRMEKLWYLQKQHVALRCQQAQETKSLIPIRDVVSQITKEVQGVFVDPDMNTGVFSEVYYSDEQDKPNPLAAYCTEILLADSKSYQNAKQFVERNRYFFAFNPALVPKEKEYYNADETLDGKLLYAASQLILTLVDVAQVLHGSNDGSSDDLLSVEQLERAFHTAFWRTAWYGAIGEIKPFEDHPNITFQKDKQVLQTTSRDPKPFAILEKARSLDVEAQAKALLETPDDASSDPSPRPARQEDIERLVSRYKTLNGALMKYLREKLAYGLPGPSMSVVMALLGHEECCRRLGFDLSKANGSAGSLDSIEREID